MPGPVAVPEPPPGADSPLCPSCTARLHQLVDDWDRFADVFLFDEETRVRGVVVAVIDAMQKCERGDHGRKAQS